MKGPLLEVDYRGIIMRRDSAKGPAFALGSPLQPLTAVLINCELKRTGAKPRSPDGVLTLHDVRSSRVQGCGAIDLEAQKDNHETVSDDPNVARLFLPTTYPMVGMPLDDISTSWDIAYVPHGKTPGDGYDLYVRPMMYGFTGVRSYLMGNGVVHATSENRRATQNDPLAEPCETDPHQACGD